MEPQIAQIAQIFTDAFALKSHSAEVFHRFYFSSKNNVTLDQTNLLNFMSLNDLSYAVRGAIFKVYNALGPGLLESVYEAALEYELTEMGFQTNRQVNLPVIYNEVKLEAGFRIDMIVENKLLIEIKSVEDIHAVHHKQVITYLKLSGMELGLLVNFNTEDIMKSIYRKINDR